MSSRYWLLAAQLVLLVPLALPQPARAATRVQECISEHVEGQLLRKQDFLVAARARLLECAKPTCPALVRDECAALGREVEAALPRVVLGDPDEREESTQRAVVSIDDSRELVPLDGRSIALDPGKHRLRFQHSDGRVREVDVVLAETESRRIQADFRPPLEGGGRDRVDGRVRPQTDDESTLEASSSGKVLLVSAAVASVALGSFTYFALSGHSLQSELERCRPNCENLETLDRMRSRYLIADASLGAALVSIGVGVYAWMQLPAAPPARRSPNASGTGISLQPVATHQQIGLWAIGDF